MLESSTPRRSRRRHPRAGVPALAFLFMSRQPLGPCLVEDISASGLRVVLGSAVGPGRMVSVLLDLPGKGPGSFQGHAQVMRHAVRGPDEHMLGLSFLNLERAAVERIQEVIARTLAATHPCVPFFDVDDDGRPRQLVLTDEIPLVG